MAGCGQSVVFLIVFYIVAFIYVKEPHYKYFGYIMLTIVYLFSLGITLQNASDIATGFQPFKTAFLQNIVVYNVFMLFAFSIVVFNLYSLIRVLNAYSFKTNAMKSFDLKLNERHKQNLRNFDNSFIVGNVAAVLLLLSFMGPNVDKIIKLPFLQFVLFLVSFICVWIETAYSTMFSYITRD
jgi:ABC-type multidrug transport system fused ATPase/permease subunit